MAVLVVVYGWGIVGKKGGRSLGVESVIEHDASVSTVSDSKDGREEGI